MAMGPPCAGRMTFPRGTRRRGSIADSGAPVASDQQPAPNPTALVRLAPPRP